MTFTPCSIGQKFTHDFLHHETFTHDFNMENLTVMALWQFFKIDFTNMLDPLTCGERS